ncbi:unnamed protein product [Ceratitis capitata]|uniref:(Mediterranean fruit fly) hypothetical protein n=1 Tax=Ceratitis capitata TaxID=7213 RepID=A0A811V0S8_CERCA|nr:unnamed protein product [Ceratitis capitata]
MDNQPTTQAYTVNHVTKNAKNEERQLKTPSTTLTTVCAMGGQVGEWAVGWMNGGTRVMAMNFIQQLLNLSTLLQLKCAYFGYSFFPLRRGVAQTVVVRKCQVWQYKCQRISHGPHQHHQKTEAVAEVQQSQQQKWTEMRESFSNTINISNNMYAINNKRKPMQLMLFRNVLKTYQIHSNLPKMVRIVGPTKYYILGLYNLYNILKVKSSFGFYLRDGVIVHSTSVTCRMPYNTALKTCLLALKVCL